MCGYVLVLPGSAGEKRGGTELKKAPVEAGRWVTVTSGNAALTSALGDGGNS